MKFYVCALLFMAAVAIAYPVEDEYEEVELAPVEGHGHRERRATCDLLSGLGVNHSACAARCIATGKTGGRCNSDAVCVCRKKSWWG